MTRQKAIEILEGLAVPINAEAAFDMAIDALKQPEIIRCKDCKWSYLHYAVNGKWYCHCLETGAAGRTEDDYCSYAEREEGEQNAD